MHQSGFVQAITSTCMHGFQISHVKVAYIALVSAITPTFMHRFQNNLAKLSPLGREEPFETFR